MLFRIENIGPLRKAEVDLSKRLILLTGPNNTGKTYLSWSIYGLFRSPSIGSSLRPVLEKSLESPDNSIDIAELRAVWPGVLEEVAQGFAKKIHHCFATEKAAFASTRIGLEAGANEPEEATFLAVVTGDRDIRFSLELSPSGSLLTVKIKPRSSVMGHGDGPTLAVDLSDPNIKTRVEAFLAQAVQVIFFPNCVLLPAERTAIDLFAKELSNVRAEVVTEAIEAELDGNAAPSISRRVGRYSWPIQDGLYTANNLQTKVPRAAMFADLADELETLLGGNVHISQEGAFQFATQGEAPIGIHLCSSVVKSLVSLVYFFRYHASSMRHWLMIDEPELNLHPDNQRRLARILAKAVNRGLRVIMSTHSDYILREINNLILLSEDREAIKEIRAKHGYAEAELLAPEKVGAYLVRNGSAEAIEVTKSGFEVKTIEDEINRLNQVSQDIYAALV